METPLNIKQIRKAQIVFVLTCTITLLLIASQVFLSIEFYKLN